uniref:Uncharacterized protein n=2 Tax=Anopheles merus TaxID=30066 RepID=A0A182VA63_ANOME
MPKHTLITKEAVSWYGSLYFVSVRALHSATPSRNLASNEEEHRQHSALSEHLVHHFLHTFEASMNPVIEDLDAHLPDQHQTSGMFSFPSDALASMTTTVPAASAPYRQTAKAPNDAGGAPMRRGRSRGGRSQSRGRRMAMKPAQEQQQHEQPSSPSPARRGRRSRSRSAAAPHKPSRSQSRRRSRSRARSRSRSRTARKRSQSGARRTSRSRRR